MIDKFRRGYFFLSNFHPVRIEGYPYLENAYQARKAPPEVREQFLHIAPDKAKEWGQAYPRLPNSLEVMEELLKIKFNIPSFKERLLNTGNEELVEGNTWHDNFWGSCICVDCANKEKLNHLGKLLMKIRKEFQDDLVHIGLAP